MRRKVKVDYFLILPYGLLSLRCRLIMNVPSELMSMLMENMVQLNRKQQDLL